MVSKTGDIGADWSSSIDRNKIRKDSDPDEVTANQLSQVSFAKRHIWGADEERGSRVCWLCRFLLKEKHEV